jgi:hypothetical protein
MKKLWIKDKDIQIIEPIKTAEVLFLREGILTMHFIPNNYLNKSYFDLEDAILENNVNILVPSEWNAQGTEKHMFLSDVRLRLPNPHETLALIHQAYSENTDNTDNEVRYRLLTIRDKGEFVFHTTAYESKKGMYFVGSGWGRSTAYTCKDDELKGVNCLNEADLEGILAKKGVNTNLNGVKLRTSYLSYVPIESCQQGKMKIEEFAKSSILTAIVGNYFDGQKHINTIIDIMQTIRKKQTELYQDAIAKLAVDEWKARRKINSERLDSINKENAKRLIKNYPQEVYAEVIIDAGETHTINENLKMYYPIFLSINQKPTKANPIISTLKINTTKSYKPFNGTCFGVAETKD